MDDPAQLSEYGKILIILLIGALLVLRPFSSTFNLSEKE